ncbi:MAG: DUF4149 domain-containing protein [Candidatus Eremiobacteraeota bacterium]|nr:DUF4149 domain-containing protein [Candidatus Eremiobacteraeota bacterium]
MVFRVAQTVRALALGLWVGAMVGFAFVIAPLVFHALGPTPAFAGIIAGAVVGIASFGFACGAAALVATAVAFRTEPRTSVLIGVLVLFMLLASWYEIHSIVPLMAHTPLQTPAYAALHHRSSALYSGILLAGLIAWIAGSLRDG